LFALDASYEKLQCDFKPVERKDAQFQMVENYVKNTHGHTHTQYSLEVLDLFDLDRQGEAEKFSSAGFDKKCTTELIRISFASSRSPPPASASIHSTQPLR